MRIRIERVLTLSTPPTGAFNGNFNGGEYDGNNNVGAYNGCVLHAPLTFGACDPLQLGPSLPHFPSRACLSTSHSCRIRTCRPLSCPNESVRNTPARARFCLAGPSRAELSGKNVWLSLHKMPQNHAGTLTETATCLEPTSLEYPRFTLRGPVFVD